MKTAKEFTELKELSAQRLSEESLESTLQSIEMISKLGQGNLQLSKTSPYIRFLSFQLSELEKMGFHITDNGDGSYTVRW